MQFIGSGSRYASHERGRADLIGAPGLATIPTSVRMQWAIARKPPTTCSVETQTDPEPVEQATQTSRDNEAQTVECEEKAVQQVTDTEMQTIEQTPEAQQEAQFFFTTLTEIVGQMVDRVPHHHRSWDWKEAVEKFTFMVNKMAESGYPMKLAPQRPMASYHE